MALLDLEKVTKRFGGVVALDGVTLSLPAGDIVGLIGPNGSGKSTLVGVATGFLPPTSGRIRFGDQDVTGTPPDAASRAGLVRTFQKLNLFLRMSALENVLVPLLVRSLPRRGAAEAAERCLELVGLSHKRDALAGTLSTGQRKRLELARVIAARPRLAFLDEVTAGVDAASVPGLLQVIRAMRDEGITVVLIEHNMRVIRELASRTVALHRGRLIEQGRTEEVLGNSEVLRTYLGEDGQGALGY